MSKKPASLTSDLLARKGEAEPSPLDPGVRMSLFAEPDFSAPGGGSGAGDDERPLPPEPEIIYTAEDSSHGSGATRLIVGGIIGAIVIGGAFLTLSGRNSQSVAPVAPEITAAAPTPAPETSLPAETTPEASIAAAPQAQPEAAEPEAAMPAAPAESAPAEPVTPAPQAALQAPAAPQADETAPAPQAETPAAPALRPGSEAATEAPKVAATAKPAPAQATKAPASAKGAYLVQVAALKDEKSAKASWRTLNQRFPTVLGGHALDIEKADLGAKGTWYRVRAAGFQTKAAATEACARLKAAGQACMVKKR